MRVLIRTGETPLDAHYRAHRERTETERMIARAVIEAECAAPTTVPTATLAGDPARLRGIPAVGRSVGGAIPGTRPDRIAA